MSPGGGGRRGAPVGSVVHRLHLRRAHGVPRVRADTGRLARAAGLRNLFITDGYATPEAIGLLAGVLDAANVDLKSFDDAFYRRLCGARLSHVLTAIAAIRRAGIWIEVTTLVIPATTTATRSCRPDRLAVENASPHTPWHVSRFFPAHRMRDVPATPLGSLARAAAIGRAAGIEHVYVGNAPSLASRTRAVPGAAAWSSSGPDTEAARC